jgi:hypothetical protein
MKFSNPSNCIISRNGTCLKHYPRRMLQILSLRLAKTPVDCGSIELYGYIAAQDNLDILLNYVVNFSRGGPIVVEQVHIHTYLQLFHKICIPNTFGQLRP